MRGDFLLGVAVLTIASGILTAISGFPLLYLPSGSVRDQNFMPVTGQAIALFVFEYIVLGLVMVVMGVLFLAAARWSMVWGTVVSALSATSFFASVFSSTGVTVIASFMGLLGGLLGLLSRPLKIPETVSSRSWGNSLKTFPFALAGVGSWEFGGIFLGCGPPSGIGTGACDLLGPGFYLLSSVGLASVFALITTPVWKSLRRSPTEPESSIRPGKSAG